METNCRPGEAEKTAAASMEDRRRPGRPKEVSPELIPILRGQFDAEAPPDPVVELPGRGGVDRDLVVGVVCGAGLLALGVVLRFIA